MTNKSDQKRKTLSLKIDADSKHSLKHSSNGNNNFDIAIKKRRRRGLAIDLDKPEKKQSSNISSKLTDTEFKVRVKVLQDAFNKEQQEKHNTMNSEHYINDVNNDININNNLIKNINEENQQISDKDESTKHLHNKSDIKYNNGNDYLNSNKSSYINASEDNKHNQEEIQLQNNIKKENTSTNEQQNKYTNQYSNINKSNIDEDIEKMQPVVFRATEFKKFNKQTKSTSDKPNRDRSNRFNRSSNTVDKSNNNCDRSSRFNDNKPISSFNNRQDRLNKEQKPKRWSEQNNERDKNRYNNKQSFNNKEESNTTIKQRSYNTDNIDPSNIPVNKNVNKNNNTKTAAKFKAKFNNDFENKKKNTLEKHSTVSKKITRVALDRALNDESEERIRSLASIKRAILKSKNTDKNNKPEHVKVRREVLIPDNITVGELASRMAVKASEVVKYLMSVGTMATINQLIDGETAEIVCTSFGHTPKRVSDNIVDFELDFANIDDNAELIQRAPIVAVMGHVDHGKTTLLDTLRQASVAQKEAGGITQHVASYQVEVKGGKKITFIDTPGHAAFTSIRARGAKLTDIIVLVVAADDGIKEQTIEVIKQAQSQNVPLVVAINKIDKPDINITKVKTDLMNYDIILEEFGGETLCCEISAKNNINLEKLLETILLQADICDLKANPNRNANGTVLEARVDKGRGIVSSVIIQGGTIKNGDIFVAGSTYGKVRAMYNNAGEKLNNIGPSTPIELIGFDSTPEPGDTIVIVENEQKAREIAEKRKESKKNANANKISIKSINQVMAQESVKILNVFAKADVYGSLEAITTSLEAIKHPEIIVKVIGKDIGIISESDIAFSIPSSAIVVGFNVNSTAAAKELAKLNNIKILNHNVIYHLIEEIKSIMSSMLDPIIEEQYIGTADVKKLFVISRVGTIAGCYVSDGIIKRNNSKIKVIRNGKCIFEGKIKSMKHEKDEIKESKQNHECGILAEGYNDFQEGDRIECYEITQKARTIE